MTRLMSLLSLCLLLAACGGGGGGQDDGGGATPPAILANFAAITVDAGPAELQSGPDGGIAANSPFVSVTLCAPGPSTC